MIAERLWSKVYHNLSTKVRKKKLSKEYKLLTITYKKDSIS